MQIRRRMKQFYEIYHDNEKLSALLRVLSWTHHCILMAQCKTDEERCFYAELCAKSAWLSRELETGEFEPSQLGQLSFYLEALDRDHKKPHENPSIGVLLCRNKDDEVVEYALSRTLSPALVADYEHNLISKALLKQKMHEWTALIEAGKAESEAGDE